MNTLSHIDTQNTISKWMTTNPIVIREDKNLSEAIDLFTEYNFYGIPVVNKDNFLEGMVTKDIIMKALYSNKKTKTIKDLMISSLEVVVPLDPLEKALSMKEGCLPVINENRKLVGIITRTDLLRAKSSQFEKIQHSLKAMTILQKVLDNIYEGFVVIDNQGCIVEINDAYCQILKKKREEVIFKLVTDVIVNTRLHLIIKSGEEERNELQQINENKYIVHRIPLTENGEIKGAIGLLLDHKMDNFFSYKKKYNVDSITKNKYDEDQLNSIIGSSNATMTIKKFLKRIASLPSNVLITGETGTGKELHAKLIHQLSNFSNGKFVSVNCAGIPETLLESELFGYEPGAFTDALSNGKKGKFELANNGTIFLDEIGDMPLSMQSKLLRTLEEKAIDPIGGTTSKKIDVRIIAATNQNLHEKIKNGEFRLDLFYRLNTFELELLPLRDHSEDISELVNHFIQYFSKVFKKPIPKLEKNIYTLLISYKYPGNIRELSNICERLVGLSENGEISTDAFSDKVLLNASASPEKKISLLKTAKNTSEKKKIVQVLNENNGNKSTSAKKLGISRSTLYKKIREFGL